MMKFDTMSTQERQAAWIALGKPADAYGRCTIPDDSALVEMYIKRTWCDGTPFDGDVSYIDDLYADLLERRAEAESEEA